MMKIILTENQYNLLIETTISDNMKGIEKYWKSKLNKGQEITFDKDDLNISTSQNFHLN
jgi:hypothetical protein